MSDRTNYDDDLYWLGMLFVMGSCIFVGLMIGWVIWGIRWA